MAKVRAVIKDPYEILMLLLLLLLLLFWIRAKQNRGTPVFSFLLYHSFFPENMRCAYEVHISRKHRSNGLSKGPFFCLEKKYILDKKRKLCWQWPRSYIILLRKIKKLNKKQEKSLSFGKGCIDYLILLLYNVGTWYKHLLNVNVLGMWKYRYQYHISTKCIWIFFFFF